MRPDRLCNDMENDTPTNSANNAAKKVLDKIRANQVTMRPRFFFTLKTALLVIVALITLFVTVSIGSFILFTIRTSYETSLLGFGPSGLRIFLSLFPWPLFILDIACIFLLESMLRRFRFGYRSPLLYLLFGILVVILSTTSLIDGDRVTDVLLRGAHDLHLPIVGDFYDRGRRPPPLGSGACPCTVLAINGNTLTMQENLPDEASKQVTVILPPGQSTSTMRVGEQYFIVGTSENGILHAFGVRKMDGDNDGDDLPPGPNGRI